MCNPSVGLFWGKCCRGVCLTRALVVTWLTFSRLGGFFGGLRALTLTLGPRGPTSGVFLRAAPLVFQLAGFFLCRHLTFQGGGFFLCRPLTFQGRGFFLCRSLTFQGGGFFIAPPQARMFFCLADLHASPGVSLADLFSCLRALLSIKKRPQYTPSCLVYFPFFANGL